MKSKRHSCPVCDYPGLLEPPRSPSGGGSYEICPSCGFQFGFDDDDKGITYTTARATWIAKGSPWTSKGTPQPRDWPVKKVAQKAPKKKTVKKAVKKKKA